MTHELKFNYDDAYPCHYSCLIKDNDEVTFELGGLWKFFEFDTNESEFDNLRNFLRMHCEQFINRIKEDYENKNKS